MKLQSIPSGRLLILRSSSEPEKFEHTLHVRRRIDPRPRLFCGLGHVDGLTVPEDPELLEGLRHLQGRRLPAHEALQEAGPVGVQADMPQEPDGLRRRLAPTRELVAMSGYGCPREVECVAVRIRDHLDQVRIEEVRPAPNRIGQGRHSG